MTVRQDQPTTPPTTPPTTRSPTMTQSTNPVGVALRYRLPGAAQDVDMLFAVPADVAERARSVLSLEDQQGQAEIHLPPSAAAFVRLLMDIQAKLEADDVALADQGIANPVPGTHIIPSCSITDLRMYGSSPKQIASLLACNTGYFNHGANPDIFFSRRRFAPTPAFYDLAQEGVSA